MVEKGEFLGCHVSSELYRTVVEEAKRRGTSVSGVIREALVFYLSRRGEDVDRLKEALDELKAKLSERDRELEALKNAVKLKERELEELRDVLYRVGGMSKAGGEYTSKPAAALKGISDKLKSYRCYLGGVHGGDDLIPSIRRLIEQAAAIIDGMATH